MSGWHESVARDRRVVLGNVPSVLSLPSTSINLQKWHLSREAAIRPPIGKITLYKRGPVEGTLVFKAHTTISSAGSVSCVKGRSPSCAEADVRPTSWLSSPCLRRTGSSQRDQQRRGGDDAVLETNWAKGVLDTVPGTSSPSLRMGSHRFAIPPSVSLDNHIQMESSGDATFLRRSSSKLSLSGQSTISLGEGALVKRSLSKLSLGSGEGEGALVRRSPSKSSMKRSAATASLESMESNPADIDALAAERQSSKVSRSSSKPKGSLAELAHKRSMSFDTVKSNAEIFCRFATLPGLDENEDILWDGVLDEDAMIALVCALTGVSSIDDLTPEMQQVMAISERIERHIDFCEFTSWYCNRAFLEYVNLTKDQLEVREIGHRLGLTPAEIDHYKALYDKYDTDGSGGIDLDEFRELMHICMKCPKTMRIPETRIMHFWAECDADSSGIVDLREFITFYKKYFDVEAEDPEEDFYRGVRDTSKVLRDL